MPDTNDGQQPVEDTSRYVAIRFRMRNAQEGLLADTSGPHLAVDRELGEELAEAARADELYLVRAVELPGLPRVGETVTVHPGALPVTVTGVHWRVEARPGQPRVVVDVEEVDEDYEPDSLRRLLGAGWRPDLDEL